MPYHSGLQWPGQMVYVFSPEIAALTALTSLNLSDNQLTCPLSAAIGALVSLRTLHLAGNFFQLPGGNVPSSFVNLRELEHFSLRGVRCGHFPPTIFPPVPRSPRSEEVATARRSRIHWSPYVDVSVHELRGREEVQGYISFMNRRR